MEWAQEQVPSPDWETDYGAGAVLYWWEAVLTINNMGIVAKALRWARSSLGDDLGAKSRS